MSNDANVVAAACMSTSPSRSALVRPTARSLPFLLEFSPLDRELRAVPLLLGTTDTFCLFLAWARVPSAILRAGPGPDEALDDGLERRGAGLAAENGGSVALCMVRAILAGGGVNKDVYKFFDAPCCRRRVTASATVFAPMLVWG